MCSFSIELMHCPSHNYKGLDLENPAQSFVETMKRSWSVPDLVSHEIFTCVLAVILLGLCCKKKCGITDFFLSRFCHVGRVCIVIRPHLDQWTEQTSNTVRRGRRRVCACTSFLDKMGWKIIGATQEMHTMTSGYWRSLVKSIFFRKCDLTVYGCNRYRRVKWSLCTGQPKLSKSALSCQDTEDSRCKQCVEQKDFLIPFAWRIQSSNTDSELTAKGPFGPLKMYVWKICRCGRLFCSLFFDSIPMYFPACRHLVWREIN